MAWPIAGPMTSPAAAQPVARPEPDRPAGPTPAEGPPIASAVKKVLAADYLTPDELKDKRIFHGLWREGDLDTPTRAARAALIAGELDNPALKLNSADPLDRAEAAFLRGECREALLLLDDLARAGDEHAKPLRAQRLRAACLETLGDFKGAAATAEAAGRALAEGKVKLTAPDDIVEGIRALAILSRLRGPGEAAQAAGAKAGERGEPGVGAGDFHAMMAMLDSVRDRIDRLYWPSRLAEAELLYEKDNGPEATAALQEVLSLNPSCAQAWAMLGQMTVDGFNLGAAEQIAARLDLLAAGRGGEHDPAAGEEGDGGGGISATAGILRARAYLRINDPDGAERALDPVLARYPRQREAMAVRCAVEGVRYESDSLARLLKEYDELSPGSPLALFEVGSTLSEARQYGPAADYLGQAAERMPAWARPVIELGLLEVQSGRDDQALAALEKATALDPFNIRAANTLKLEKELKTYNRIEGEHYIIRYKPGDGGGAPGGGDGVLARDMLTPLEENYRKVCGTGPGGINFEPAEKTVIDLMPDHEWFGVRIAGMPQIHTIAASTGRCIAMEAPRDGRGHLGTYDWVRVVRHEFTHTVTLARTHNRIPHWFTEAAAVYLELSPRDFNTCQLLAAALKNDGLFGMTEINTAFVRPRRPTDRQQAYAQGHWMYEFILQQWGAAAPLDLMDLYARGQREEAAFQSVLGVSREQFLDRFKPWAHEQVVKWGLELPEGVPSIPDMQLEDALSDPDQQESINEHLAKAAADAGLAAAGLATSPDVQPWTPEIQDPTPEIAAKWLEKYPDHPDVLELSARLAIADSESRGGKKGQATPAMAPILERYAAARPVDPFPHQLLARFYLGGDEPAKAIEHLEYLDAREQKSASYAAELARRYAATEDWARAGAKAERATQISPFNAEMRELAATVAIKRGDYKAAERHITALVELEPAVAVHKQRLEAVRRLVK